MLTLGISKIGSAWQLAKSIRNGALWSSAHGASSLILILILIHWLLLLPLLLWSSGLGLNRGSICSNWNTIWLEPWLSWLRILLGSIAIDLHVTIIHLPWVELRVWRPKLGRHRLLIITLNRAIERLRANRRVLRCWGPCWHLGLRKERCVLRSNVKTL